MTTEVLFVRVPVSVKIELEAVAAKHGASLSKITARALELYLSEHCGVTMPESVRIP